MANGRNSMPEEFCTEQPVSCAMRHTALPEDASAEPDDAAAAAIVAACCCCFHNDLAVEGCKRTNEF